MPVTKIFKSVTDTSKSIIPSHIKLSDVEGLHLWFNCNGLTDAIILDSEDITELINELQYIKAKLDNE